MAVDPGTATLIVGALGAGGNMLGQDKANKDNLKIAREQMAFQERMSNTAYRRATADMREAGLNPMLAYGQGGASSPSGASANMENIVGDSVTSGISSALEGRRLSKDIDEAESRIKLNAENAKTAVNLRLLQDSQRDAHSSQALINKLNAIPLAANADLYRNHPRLLAWLDKAADYAKPVTSAIGAASGAYLGVKGAGARSSGPALNRTSSGSVLRLNRYGDKFDD